MAATWRPQIFLHRTVYAYWIGDPENLRNFDDFGIRGSLGALPGSRGSEGAEDGSLMGSGVLEFAREALVFFRAWEFSVFGLSIPGVGT
jgi:hypothetical protein